MGATLSEIAERLLIAFDENVPVNAYHCPFFILFLFPLSRSPKCGKAHTVVRAQARSSSTTQVHTIYDKVFADHRNSGSSCGKSSARTVIFEFEHEYNTVPHATPVSVTRVRLPARPMSDFCLETMRKLERGSSVVLIRIERCPGIFFGSASGFSTPVLRR